MMASSAASHVGGDRNAPKYPAASFRPRVHSRSSPAAMHASTRNPSHLVSNSHSGSSNGSRTSVASIGSTYRSFAVTVPRVIPPLIVSTGAYLAPAATDPTRPPPRRHSAVGLTISSVALAALRGGVGLLPLISGERAAGIGLVAGEPAALVPGHGALVGSGIAAFGLLCWHLDLHGGADRPVGSRIDRPCGRMVVPGAIPELAPQVDRRVGCVTAAGPNRASEAAGVGVVMALSGRNGDGWCRLAPTVHDHQVPPAAESSGATPKAASAHAAP